MKNKDVFLDGASNTPLDKRVLKAMKPYLSQKFVGNSQSIHDFGIKSMAAVEESRAIVAQCLGLASKEVFFTSGATESNNWVIKSLSLRALRSGKGHIVCSTTEHSSVINACKEVEKWGIHVTYVPGKGFGGEVLLRDIKKAITPDTFLICIMSLNNETGVRNDADSIAKYAHKVGILTLIDCTQWISYGGKSLSIVDNFPHGDFFSFSAHKIYGPTGVGCLIARSDVIEHLDPLISGGSQEGGLRGGTSNTAGIVGAAKSIELMRQTDLSEYYKELYSYLIEHLGPKVRLNGKPDHLNIINLCFSKYFNFDNLAAVLATYGIAVSSGSACDSTHNETLGDFHPSHVLMNLGLSEKDIRNSIRLSFTKYTTKKDIDQFIKAISLLEEENGRN